MSAAPVIAPFTAEARLVRAATLDVLLLHALADKPRTMSAVEAGARLQALSEVAVHVLRIAGLSIPAEFRVLVADAVREVGPCPEGRGAPEGWKSSREPWHAQVLDAVNARLTEAAPVTAEPGAPSDEEVQAALDVLRRAGWEVQERQGFGDISGGFLVTAYAAGVGDVGDYRARVVREPWTEVTG